MKKDSITIPYDEEKLAALRLYLEQKGQSVEQEMVSAVNVLYTKSITGLCCVFLLIRLRSCLFFPAFFHQGV